MEICPAVDVMVPARGRTGRARRTRGDAGRCRRGARPSEDEDVPGLSPPEPPAGRVELAVAEVGKLRGGRGGAGQKAREAPAAHPARRHGEGSGRA